MIHAYFHILFDGRFAANWLDTYTEISPRLFPFAHTAGVAKILVGEIIDNARLVRREWGEDESQPIQPRYIGSVCSVYRLSLLRI